MPDESINLKNIPYTKWLEESLQDIIKLPVRGICLNVILEDNDIYTNYYRVSTMEKLAIAGLLQQDAMYNSMEANGLIKKTEEVDSDGEEEI